MTRNALLSGSKVLFFILLICSTTLSVAQKRKSGPPGFKSFLDTQWWLGLRFGVNFTDPIPGDQYSSFSPINYDEETLKKNYNSYSLPGGQAGIDITFFHKGFSFALQPTFKIIRYEYINQFQWFDDTGQLGAELGVEQKVEAVEVPFIIKYDVLKGNKIRPFLLLGMQYSFIVGAQKQAKLTYTETLQSTQQEYVGGDFTLGNKDELTNFYGALGGIGASFDYWNIRTVLEATYLRGFSSVTSQENPFQENELSSVGDVNDELKINNINISLSFVFPLRYIDKTFQSN